MVLLRFHQNGLLDDDFGDLGLVETGFFEHSLLRAFQNEILIDANDHILMTGPIIPRACVVRFQIDGHIDNDFGEAGTACLPLEDDPEEITFYRLALHDGNLIAAGSRESKEDDFDILLARFFLQDQVDLSVNIYTHPNRPQRGDRFFHKVRVSNAGPNVARDAQLQYFFPPDVSFEEPEISQGNCVVRKDIDLGLYLDCVLGDIQVGRLVYLRFDTRIHNFDHVRNLHGLVTVTSSSFDVNNANNRSEYDIELR